MIMENEKGFAAGQYQTDLFLLHTIHTDHTDSASHNLLNPLSASVPFFEHVIEIFFRC